MANFFADLLKKLPDGQPLTEQQKRDIRTAVVQQGKKQDYQNFRQGYNEAPAHIKKEMVGEVKSTARLDTAAGGFGTARRNLEATNTLYTPLLEVQPRPNVRGTIVPVRGTFGTKEPVQFPKYASTSTTAPQNSTGAFNIRAPAKPNAGLLTTTKQSGTQATTVPVAPKRLTAKKPQNFFAPLLEQAKQTVGTAQIQLKKGFVGAELLAEKAVPGLKPIRESIEQGSLEPEKKFLKEATKPFSEGSISEQAKAYTNIFGTLNSGATSKLSNKPIANKISAFDQAKDEVMQSIKHHEERISTQSLKPKGDVLDVQILKEAKAQIESGKVTPEQVDEAITVLQKHGVDIKNPEVTSVPLKQKPLESKNTVDLSQKKTHIQDPKTGRLMGSKRAEVNSQAGFIDPGEIGKDIKNLFTGRKATPEEAPKLQQDLKVLHQGAPPQSTFGRVGTAQNMSQEGISLSSDITKSKGKRQVINLKNLKISDEGKKVIESTIEDIRPRMEKITGKTLKNQEVIDFAERSSKALDKVVGREQTLQWEASLLRARQKLSAAAERGVVDKEFVDALLTVKTHGTDIARKLQSFSVGAEAIEKTPMEAILEAVLKVNDNVDEITKAAQGVDFTDAEQATAFYRQFVHPKLSEWVDLVRYNSMLSSPTTHIVNTFSNLVNSTVVAPTEKLVAGGIDFLTSTVRGSERTMFAGEAGSYLKGYVSAAKEASQRFADVMRGRKNVLNLDTRSIPPAVKGFKGKVSKTLSIPLRLLEASDQFFTVLTEAGERSGLALRESKGVPVKLPGIQASDKAAYRLFRQDLFPDEQGMLLDAVDTFTSKLMSLRESDNALVSQLAKFTVPFVKTPMNILKQGIEYSPLGFSTAVGAKNVTEQTSKAIIGSSIVAGAGVLLHSGRLAGAEPIQTEEKNAWRAAGKQPWSVKIGDTWVSYSKLPPALAFSFSTLSMVHEARNTKKIDDSTADILFSAMSKYGQFLSDQSYVKSIGDLLAAAQGEAGAFERMIGNYPQQLIPFRALGGWFARLFDDTQRIVDNKAEFIDKQMQLLMMNFPGLSQKLQPRLGPTGEPIPNQKRVLNAFSPIRITEENDKFKAFLEESEALSKASKQQTQERNQNKEEALKLHNEFKKLSSEEANAKVNELKEKNPAVYKSLLGVIRTEKLGLDANDKKLQSLDVANGTRAQYIHEKALKLNTAEERNAYIEELQEKKIVTPEVLEQLNALAK